MREQQQQPQPQPQQKQEDGDSNGTFFGRLFWAKQEETRRGDSWPVWECRPAAASGGVVSVEL